MNYTNTALLNEVNFIWDNNRYKFEQMLLELETFNKKYNSFDVPNKYDKVLSDWVKTIRKSYKKSTLIKYKIDILNKIGFEWQTVNKKINN